jgi:hypothetical protein
MGWMATVELGLAMAPMVTGRQLKPGIKTMPQCAANVADGSSAAVRPRGAEGPQHFQYPTTCCAAAHRGFVPLH